MRFYSAEVAELVDALDSKSSDGNIVRVRFPPSVRKGNILITQFIPFFYIDHAIFGHPPHFF
jgi:hypothetical protein